MDCSGRVCQACLSDATGEDLFPEDTAARAPRGKDGSSSFFPSKISPPGIFTEFPREPEITVTKLQ